MWQSCGLFLPFYFKSEKPLDLPPRGGKGSGFGSMRSRDSSFVRSTAFARRRVAGLACFAGIFMYRHFRTFDSQPSRKIADILTQVKLFHMAKPVNPSIPPPVVDDAGEEDAANHPGLALLGLLGVEPPSLSGSASPPSSATPSPSTLVSSSTTSHAPVGGTAATSAQKPPEGQGGGGGGTRVGSTGDSAGSEGAETGRAAGGSKLFKGFEKTETVVRRKKQVGQPPPPPGAPPPLPPPDEGAHLTHR